MAKADLGTKRTDPDTGKKFYDLNRDPVVSPYSGKSGRSPSLKKAPLRQSSSRLKKKKSRKSMPKTRKSNSYRWKTPTATTAATISDTGDDDDDVEIGDDDDTFLEADEDDDDDDMSGIIGVPGDDEEA